MQRTRPNFESEVLGQNTSLTDFTMVAQIENVRGRTVTNSGVNTSRLITYAGINEQEFTRVSKLRHQIL